MLFKLSWKNIWRNPARSGAVITAVILGTWAAIFLASFYTGMYQQHLQNELNNHVGHLQLHTPEYNQEIRTAHYIPNPDSLHQLLTKTSYVKSVSPRTLIAGLASSSANNYGASIVGVNPTYEKQVTDIHNHLVEGTYLDTTRRNPVIVGKPLAERLDLELGSRLVLQFQDLSNEITGGLFRVSGIYSTNNKPFDKSHVFVRQSDLSPLLGQSGLVHELLLKVDDYHNAGAYADSLNRQLDMVVAESWQDVSPMLNYMNSSLDMMLWIFMAIIILALTLGIINTMLMAVLERTRELGMLMAIGMNRVRIFSMILIETFLLTITGVPIGMFLSWASISALQDTGIDLSSFAEGLRQYGFSTHIYPVLEPEHFIYLGLMVCVASLLAAIYPAIKALKLNPVEAIRKF